jgi:2-methylcitrate dehydratase PrpD
MVINSITAFCRDLDYTKLPGQVVEMSKRCFLDYIGVTFAGHQTAAGQAALKSAACLGGNEICTVIGRKKTASPLAAAFINGTLSSALDLDSGHRGAVGHPAVMVLSTALAAAELKQGVTGKQFIEAIAAGYEVAARCGMVMNSCHQKLFYGSGGWAVHGAAAAAARLLGLEGELFKHAVTIGEVYGPTAQCGKSIAYGAMTKESIGWGATTALFSVFLAQDGFTGPGEILLDDDYYNPEAKAVFKTLGREFEINNTYFKQFASCRWSHSPISAVLAIREKYRPPLQSVKRIRVETFSKALTLNHISPHSTEAAQYSIPYTVAAALCYGTMGPAQVAEESLQAPVLRELISKVELVHAPDLESLFPAKRPARVVVEMDGGETYCQEVHLVAGDPEYPLSWEELEEKFSLCAAPYLRKEASRRIAGAVYELEACGELGEITRLLRI